MKKIFSLLAVALLSLAAVAQTFTPTSEGNMTQNGITVAFAQGGGGTAPTWYDANGLRLYANNTITISGGTLTSIQLVFAKQGSKPYASLTASAGTLTSGGESSGAEDLKTDTWTGSTGSVTFTLGASGQRVIKEIIVNGDNTQTGGGSQGGGGGQGTGGGNQGEGGGQSTGSSTLNPAYEYSEPTIVSAGNLTAEIGNNKNYTFVENNIQVTCPMGAIVRESTTSPDYFGCNAGQTITFTASQPIKGIVVDGYIKKDFDATASAGTIAFVDATEDAVEADPVLVLTDINSNTVTLTCVKQIRFYNVEFYFEANPEVELGEGGEYSYDYEPTEPTTFNLVMDELEVTDMTDLLGYKAVSMSFYNDEAQLDVTAFADYNETTGIAAGTYPIDFTYAEGTIEASVGGDEALDYGTYLMTHFEEIEDELWYDPYYIVSGTLTVTAEGITLNAQSYNGSTIDMTYSFGPTSIKSAVQTMEAKKVLENGQFVIKHNGLRYNVLGKTF